MYDHRINLISTEKILNFKLRFRFRKCLKIFNLFLVFLILVENRVIYIIYKYIA